MKERILYYAIKYEGNYDKIYRALKTDEKYLNINYIGKYITILDTEYPKELLCLNKPPFILFYKGNIELLKTNKVAIVGSRMASNYGIKWTKSLVKSLMDTTIVSGMANGIDSVAHYAALSNNTNTIAVLGSGINYVYPHNNLELYKELANKQLVISEYPYNTKPKRYFFPFRNRIIAALSKTVYVMEAGLKSGTLLTVNDALDLNKEVHVLPHRIDDINGLGCNLLIQQGASVIMIEDMK